MSTGAFRAPPHQVHSCAPSSRDPHRGCACPFCRASGNARVRTSAPSLARVLAVITPIHRPTLPACVCTAGRRGLDPSIHDQSNPATSKRQLTARVQICILSSRVMLQTSSLDFERFPATLGYSTRHERDMGGGTSRHSRRWKCYDFAKQSWFLLPGQRPSRWWAARWAGYRVRWGHPPTAP